LKRFELFMPIWVAADSPSMSIGKQFTSCAGNGVVCVTEGVRIRPFANAAVPGGVPTSSGDDLLRLIIDETMTTNVQSPTAGTKLSKLKSKYFSLLDYAYTQRVTTPDLVEFIKEHGGLNFKTSVPKKTKQKKGGSGK
jgi:hypothetical protein